MIVRVPYLPARRMNRDETRATLACEDVPMHGLLTDRDIIEDQVESCIEWNLRAYGRAAWAAVN